METPSTPKGKQKIKPGVPRRGAQGRAQDDQVMATNSSSIVSKRCVEKLYYPDEPHFFRFFVNKFQRRAPLINRGYHFRLHVIDVLVRNFLRSGGTRKVGDWHHDGDDDAGSGERKKSTKKVIVNLGCGSDVLPWQCLTRYPEACEGVKFVDVDFPDLIERKRQTVEATAELKEAFTGVKPVTDLKAPIVFGSDQYVQIGCDLRQLETLRKALESVVDVEDCSFLFVAEVSITYMETEGADGVIKWASSLGETEFVLLEQILPEGEQHPFASTMLSHFRKLNTPLKSVHAYPTLNSQIDRFSSRGWNSVLAWNLWSAWADQTFLSTEERRWLEEVEPFDEWEEFALFCSHYCLVHAKTSKGELRAVGNEMFDLRSQPGHLTMRSYECSGQRGQRRFAAAMLLPGDEGATDRSPGIIVNTLGMGTKSRLQSCDIFSPGDNSKDRELAFDGGGPAARMCHSLSDLGGDYGVLLAGGRGSPSDPYRDCWIFNKKTTFWKRTHDLPAPLYRHSVTSLGQSGLALLAGGKLSATGTSGDFLLYNPTAGWVVCGIAGDTKPQVVYGAIFASSGVSDGRKDCPRGIFAGGICDGLIARQVLAWELDISDIKKPTIRFQNLVDGNQGQQNTLERFGAVCYWDGEKYTIIGGVIRDQLLPRSLEFLHWSDVWPGLGSIKKLLVSNVTGVETTQQLPLCIGTSTIPLRDGGLVVLGGGATCFSMGTFWNKGIFSFYPAAQNNGEMLPSTDTTGWIHEKTLDIVPGESHVPVAPMLETGATSDRQSIRTIPRVGLETAEDFSRIVRNGQPIVLDGLNLGRCVSEWNLDHLTEKVGHERKVVVHESSSQAMDFNSKNFRYVTTSFSDFTEKVKRGDKTYLRALSEEKPTESPALLADDFPSLALDFVLPPQLFQVTEKIFSSVLRVSGPVNMWLHYDVMANVYCQVGGSKRLILFPPSDVEHLSFAPGSSSSSVDVFASMDSQTPAQTHPHEAILSPGDVLFLPPLWLHTATPISNSSIAVNVFFRDLDANYYAAGRDVYGNRDLAAYEKGRQDVARIANSFQKLPAKTREFYLLRLADELRRKARG